MPDALDYVQIQNLLYRYCDAVDHADRNTLDALFAHADVYVGGSLIKAGSIPGYGDAFSQIVRIYPETGGLKTRHLCTNLMIDFEDDQHARCRSCFVVFQATQTLPLQAIMTGTYHDRLEKVEGQWRFAERRWEVGLVGDLSAHLLQPLGNFTESAHTPNPHLNV